MNRSLFKIGIIVGHPTQFEGPLYKYLHQDPAFDLTVIYMDGDRVQSVFDNELQMDVTWGIDLLNGYNYKILPNTNRLAWLTKVITSNSFDLLILNGYNRIELLWSLVLAKYCNINTALRLDSVYNPMDSAFKRLSKKIILPFIYKLYDAFLATSTTTKAFLISKGVSAKKIFFFTYAVDQTWFRNYSSQTQSQKDLTKKNYSIPKDKKIVISVSKLSARETPWDLLNALSLIDEDCVCILIGDGPDRKLVEDYITTIPNKVILLLGYIQYPLLPSLYAISDVFVHAAMEEPYGVSVAEALSCGVPVIASNRVGSASDLLIEGKNGSKYEHGNHKDLAKKIDYYFSRDDKKFGDVADKQLLIWDYANTSKEILACTNYLLHI